MALHKHNVGFWPKCSVTQSSYLKMHSARSPDKAKIDYVTTVLACGLRNCNSEHDTFDIRVLEKLYRK